MGMELARKPGRIGGILATCTLAFGGWFALAAAAPESPAPLYKDASQPIERRVEDLLSRIPAGRPVVQISYGPLSPVVAMPDRYQITHLDFVVRNIPPAQLWTYRRTH